VAQSIDFRTAAGARDDKIQKGVRPAQGLPYFGFAEAAKAGGNAAGFNQAGF
jgi:hypothetical protein